MDHSDHFWIGNIASTAAIIGSVLGWVPVIGALAALIWYGINIYESATVQRYLAMRRVQKIAALRAKILVLEGHIVLPPPEKKDED